MFYYPYQVRAIDICNPENPFFVHRLKEITYELRRGNEVKEVAYTDRNYKLLLYPLEYLTREFTVNGENMIPIKYMYGFVTKELKVLDDCNNYSWFLKNLIDYLGNHITCKFSKDILNWIYYILYSLHFDMYGPIKEEAAYNVLLLEEDPYRKDRILLPE